MHAPIECPASSAHFNKIHDEMQVGFVGRLLSNDRAVHLLRVNYSDQRNHKPRIFNSGGPRCDRYSPNHGTLCLCAKHGFGDRERGAIYNGVN
jgi:hypothetical protein